MVPTNDTRMSLQKKLLISTGVIVVLGAVTSLVMMLAGDSPIEVGDGSITFQYPDGINNISAHQIEADKFLHKVKTISIGDYTGALGPPIDVSGREWSIVSNNTPQFQLSLRTHHADLEKGVVATCASSTGWVASGATYTCSPTVGTQLTPATITFFDGDCPGTSPASPSCTLSCPSGKCRLELIYK
jgi:hypothetical protein